MSKFSLISSKLTSGALHFFSKTTGNDLLVFEPAADTVRIPGRVIEALTVNDLNAQSGTLSAAQIRDGILLHTSVTGGGTLTSSTGALIDAEFPEMEIGDVIKVYVINDGTQVVTLTNATGATFADTGQTIGADEGVLLLYRKTAADTYVIYPIGA